MATTLAATLVALHVLGAALWVGGQLVLGLAVGALRRALGREAAAPALRALARRAQPVLWAGLALAAASGVCLLALRGDPWSALVAPGLVGAKSALTVLAAAGAALHVAGARRRAPPWVVGGGAALALLAGLALVAVGAALRWS